MRDIDGLIGPVAGVIDAAIADPVAGDIAKLGVLEAIGDRSGPARPADRWTSRARPSFLYVMYALLLWSIPVGLIAAVRPELAAAIARGMAAYLKALPEPLYTLFGTGYLGYTLARQWGKAKGSDR